MVDKNILEYLQKVGLSQSEGEIYLKLLETKGVSIARLSKISRIPRSTITDNLSKLIQKGLVSETVVGARRVFIAAKPSKIKLLLNNKKSSLESGLAEIESLEKSLPKIIRSVEDFIPNAKLEADVTMRYYQGKNNVNTVYAEALKAKEFRAYVNAEELSKAFPKNVDLFLAAHKKRKDMHVWEIMEDSQKSREYADKMPKNRYYARFLPKHLNLSVVDYLMFDGKVAFIELKDEPNAVIVSNENYYKNARAIYELVWELLP